MPDTVLARMILKLESLTDDPRPAGCKKLRGYRDQWRIESATGALFTSSMIQPDL